ncbi:ABC transporter permease [Rhodococcus zopfii]|uniref:ABC transporter permease n=1 Tax=Rhodococcus zopfii TaxID=43772 RepID=UPI0009351B46|nr:ABC transporter permease [Rhodococcus zopfii]
MTTTTSTIPVTTADPAAENSIRMLLPHTWLQSRRLLTRWRRDPMTVVQTLAYPVAMLVMLDVVLGRQVTAFAGHDALYGTVPMVAVMSALLGSLAGTITLRRECEAGLPGRLWTLPVHRASALLSRSVAEAVRIAATTTVIVGIGMALGFRFHAGALAGALAALGFVAVPVMFGVGFAVLVTTVGLTWSNTGVVEAISLLCTLLLFFNPGFVPVSAYPGWIRPLVENQPMTAAVETMQAFSLGGPVAEPLVRTLTWSVVLIAGCAIPLVRRYRRALC